LITGQPVESLPDELRYRAAPEATVAAVEFLRQQGGAGATRLIGIHAACNTLKNQQRRCWPAQRFGQLIQRLGAESAGTRFVLFEGPADAEINQAIFGNCGAQRSQVIVARMLPMRVVGALIRQCQLFVSNDSGLMHTAAACQVPCVSLFGPTNPVWVHPWKTKHTVVSTQLSCSPCFYYSSRPLSCPAHLDFQCMRDITLDQVLAAVEQQLGKPVTA
jgi:heptosyltransferase-2